MVSMSDELVHRIVKEINKEVTQELSRGTLKVTSWVMPRRDGAIPIDISPAVKMVMTPHNFTRIVRQCLSETSEGEQND